MMVKESLFEIEKAHTLPNRIASLSSPARNEVYRMLERKEAEDMVLFEV